RHTRFSRDWSSDVCSSDLRRHSRFRAGAGPTNSNLFESPLAMLVMRFIMVKSGLSNVSFRLENECPITAFTLRFRTTKANQFAKIGRASCRQGGQIWSAGA